MLSDHKYMNIGSHDFSTYRKLIKKALIRGSKLQELREYLDDFARMATLLNPESVDRQVGKLNAILTNMLRNKGFVKNVDGTEKIIKKRDKSYTGNYKVVSTFFSSWGHENGFNQPSPVLCEIRKANSCSIRSRHITLSNQMPTLVGAYVSPKLFKKFLLDNGYLFKDLGAEADSHGEFTHMIGLYIISEESKVCNILQHSMRELYKKLTPQVWDIIFDSFDNWVTNPNVLHETLRASRHAIISEIINGRQEKRLTEEANFNTTSRMVSLQRAKTSQGMLINNCIFFKNYVDHDSLGDDDPKLIEMPGV